MPGLTVDDFDYVLPPELIAQAPAVERRASRLLHLDPASLLHDRQFADLPSLLRPNDLLVFNDTRVIKARLFGEKSSGGKVEILVERIVETDRALVHMRASKSPKAGARLRLSNAFDATVLGRAGDGGDLFDLRFAGPVLELLEKHGQTPLPPYITHTPDQGDDARYQTVYAREPGAIAAPTAGLHFDADMLATLKAQGVNTAFVTLHVGAGTFLPVRVQNLTEHVMHSELYTVTQETVDAINAARAAGGRVIAVGTTSVRALESAATATAKTRASVAAHPALDGTSTLPRPPATLDAQSGDTRLFITPGFTFHVIDAMVTNFHLPKSTLMMLISALAGTDAVKAAYAHAVAERYRFFSYGDAMLIERPLIAPQTSAGQA
ncbi:tRNA preQ1(34) S-adenosylmethionine ribosyltransferase-isomerase QueA [Pigmentiphaga aceris]|uniref:S-adenosylmethionine:tRNA ribosyltransferase-isomerase n=1 Tax=Pigmentiphaga aceris TaxID=1940612 RepID=A0A5C0B0H6_9BURK|nr:tRNA preQ1(34) S-adenosylmethionine ribosyltransferase-isomerase QueA [Pigmentiphaga aceris]QEI07885.1 tRNA preQ1(34) S-adenosylmethionine ribosyltransferase-isomerase QueA [Pigmentiphaga aceris]